MKLVPKTVSQQSTDLLQRKKRANYQVDARSNGEQWTDQKSASEGPTGVSDVLEE